MNIQLFQVDAFAERLFTGNPAAVCPLDDWLEDELMQRIAAENNLSETAFYCPKGDHFGIRWFTPEVEVDLCGHGTLATAHVIFNHRNYESDTLTFNSRSGKLGVRKEGDILTLDFPKETGRKVTSTLTLAEGLGHHPKEAFLASDYMAVFRSEDEVRALKPNFRKLKELPARGVIVTAPGKEVDFVSRFFGPKVGIDEDPVTGSAHTLLAPYWADRLGKETLTAQQLSARGGALKCTVSDDRVMIGGKAHTYLVGNIYLD